MSFSVNVLVSFLVNLIRRGSVIVFVLGIFPQTAVAFTVELGSDLQGWSNQPLTFSVNYANCSVSQDTLNAAIDSGIALWQSVPTAAVSMARGGTTTDSAANAGVSPPTITDSPAIICDPSFSADIGGGDPTIGDHVTAVTFVRADTSDNRISYAVIVLNAETGKNANVANLTPVAFSDVVAHEMGHAQGLGHSSSENALMYFNSSQKTVLNLSQDDADGISYLYPRSEPFGQFMGCGTLAVVGSDGFPGAGAAVLGLWILVCGGMVGVMKRAG